MRHALDLTRDGMISALKPGLAAQTKPYFLRDVLQMKRNRGDADADHFKKVACVDFAVRLDATIEGAHRAMTQWLRKGALTSTDWRLAFVADLEAVLAGDLTGWASQREAA